MAEKPDLLTESSDVKTTVMTLLAELYGPGGEPEPHTAAMGAAPPSAT